MFHAITGFISSTERTDWKALEENYLWRRFASHGVGEEIKVPTVLNKVRSRAVFFWNQNVILFSSVYFFSLVGMNSFHPLLPRRQKIQFFNEWFLNFHFDCASPQRWKTIFPLIFFSRFYPQLSVLQRILNVPKTWTVELFFSCNAFF